MLGQIFTMNMTWEGLMRLSLSKKRPKFQFPDTRGAGYLWLSQCTMAQTASWKCVFRTPCGAKALKKNKKRKELRCKKRTILCRMFCRRNVYIAWIGAHPTDSTAMRHFFLHTWVMLIDSLYSSLQFSTFLFSRFEMFFFFQGLSFQVLFQTAYLLFIEYCWCQFAFKRIPLFNLLPMNGLQDGSGSGMSFLSETFPSRVSGGYDHFRGVEGL